jgi:hypothetical protein
MLPGALPGLELGRLRAMPVARFATWSGRRITEHIDAPPRHAVAQLSPGSLRPACTDNP